MPNSEVKLSIVVVGYKSKDLLKICLDSIQHHLGESLLEVLVVDNGSSDGTSAMIREFFPKVCLIENQVNAGFSHAVNQGLREAKGRYLLWLNPDSELLDSGVWELIDYLEKNPKVGILGPLIQNPDGKVQFSCRSFPNHFTSVFNRYSILTKIFPKNPWSKNYLHTDWDRTKIHDVDWVSGACLLHRRELLQDVGYLDERFFMYCEDVDYCFRARKTGWYTQFHPGMKVLHHIAGSSSKLRLRMTVIRHQSMWKYYLKHYPRAVWLDLLTFSGILSRCLVVLLMSIVRSVISWSK